MPGYTNRFILLQFPELGDKVSVLIRNPKLLPPGDIEPEDVPVDADGKPLDPQAATNSMYKVIARLITAWHVYDASVASSVPDIDLDAEDLDAQLAALEAGDQQRMGPVTPENVAKLPLVILNRISEELTSVADPT